MRTHPQSAVLASLAIGLALAHVSAIAAIVTNGSLTGPNINDGVPPGWFAKVGSPDTMDVDNFLGLTDPGNPDRTNWGAKPTTSPDGGTWVGIGLGTEKPESFGQRIERHPGGGRYRLTWYDANFGYSPSHFGFTHANAVDVFVDGVYVGQGSTLALGSDWHSEVVYFYAPPRPFEIDFSLANDAKDASGRYVATAYLAVDGVRVEAPVSIPEPGTSALMLLGLGGFALRWRQRSRAVSRTTA
jgi:hypothetical protein